MFVLKTNKISFFFIPHLSTILNKYLIKTHKISAYTIYGMSYKCILKIKRNFHQINNVTCFKLKINENTAELIDYKVNVSIFKAKKKWNETKISIFYYKKNSWIHSVMLLVDNYIHICRNIIFIFLFMKVSKHLGSTKFLLLSIKLYFQISRCWKCFAKKKTKFHPLSW